MSGLKVDLKEKRFLVRYCDFSEEPVHEVGFLEYYFWSDNVAELIVRARKFGDDHHIVLFDIFELVHEEELPYEV